MTHFQFRIVTDHDHSQAVRARYLDLSKHQPRSATDAAAAATNQLPKGDDEDEYEPDYEPTEDAEQIANRLDQPPDGLELQKSEVALGPFNLPPPPPLGDQEVADYGKGTVNRVFGIMGALDDDPNRGKTQKPGFNRLAASTYNRDAWVTIIARLATRASAGLDENLIKSENRNSISRKGDFSIGNTIRDTLYLYILEDFRRRIDVAVSWLNEEWYNDRIQAQNSDEHPVLHYQKWVLKLMDGILPYLEATDKFLIRFLSEIPEVNREVLERVKKLARDPERVTLAVNAIQ